LADLDLLALDNDATRLGRVQEGLNRLQLTATLRCGDACQPAAWWDGRPFDAILLDAPCTASGIVRRHPDIRWLRRPEDVTTLARLQAQMLDALWPLLAPGGRLLYATCSLFPAEGQRQIDAFLQRLGPGAARLDPAAPGHLLPLPDNAQTAVATADGFFYALIHKP
jgi:16S rRNA (cytosine967-C5)-methyltransferase